MALSKTVKARIRWNKDYRYRMWQNSRLHGKQWRYFINFRMGIAYNVQAAKLDEFGDYFFPVICTPDETLGA